MRKDDNNTRNKLLDAAFLEVYQEGYHGAATSAILSHAKVPKGSMYHFFSSKKELVLAVIAERTFPKMEAFFDFKKHDGESVLDALKRIFTKMSEHKLLIANGCPMHRIMVEMAPLDQEFHALLMNKFDEFVQALSSLLQSAIDNHELIAFNTKELAQFIITSTWGFLSLPPSYSSKLSFIAHTNIIISLLTHYRSQN